MLHLASFHLIVSSTVTHLWLFTVLFRPTQPYVLPSGLPGNPSISHFNGAEEFYDGVEDGQETPSLAEFGRGTAANGFSDLRRRPSQRDLQNYPENDGFLYGGYPEIPGVMGEFGYYNEEENKAANAGTVDGLNVLLDLPKTSGPGRWNELHFLLEEQEKKMADVGHLEVDENWPRKNVADQMGQVSGITVCGKGIVHALHRGERKWFEAFDLEGRTKKHLARIPQNVVVSIDPKTGADLNRSWGNNTFYMPHGLHIDHEGNFWVTDIAAHQVLKFPWARRSAPSLVLGEALTSGSDASHFCKPTDVGVARNGDVFVADGYCNSRIMKFDASGKLLATWGKKTPANVQGPQAPEDTLSIPHSIHVDDERDLVCVADRENQRVVCYDAGLKSPTTGRVNRVYTSRHFGRIFAITIDPKLGVIYAISGPSAERHSRGFTIDMDSGDVLETWRRTWSPRFGGAGDALASDGGTSGGSFSNGAGAGSAHDAAFDLGLMPHDVEVSPLDGDVFVAAINPTRVTKFKHIQY